MAEFGKRRSAQGARTSNRPAAPSADLAGAVAAVETGKLPHWATTSPLWTLFPFAIAAVLFWLTILPYAGGLLQDHRLAGTWQPAYDMRTIKGGCTRYQLILTTCEAKIASQAEPDQPPIAVDYMMAFSSGGGELLIPMRSTVDPSAVTIGYAAETKLVNRTLTFLVIAIFVVVLVVATVRKLLRGQYEGGAAHRALMAGLEELQARADRARTDPAIG